MASFSKERLILEIIVNFIPEDVLSDADLHHIALAESEYANGETTGHNDIDWD